VPFFELRTSRDMLAKAHREYAKLLGCFDIDNVFNFFVTAHHIRDYISKTKAVEQATLDAFVSDQDIKDCRDLCDKGKHLNLTKRDDPRTHVWSGCVGGAPLGVMPLGGGDVWVLFSGRREVDVKRLAQRVLEKWDRFFEENKL